MFFRSIPSLVLTAMLAVGAAFTAAPAGAQDASEFFVRLNRLENQMREMSGRIEQLQFENRRLQDQLKRFQDDVDFRFQEKGGARSGPSPGAAPAQPRGQKRSDAFDPATTPDAPGAPQQLGAAAGGSTGAIAVIDESDRPDVPRGALPAPRAASAPLDINALAREGAREAAPARSGPSIAATGSADPRQDYETAVSYLRQKQYEQAEMGFRQFLQSHPRDRLVPDATYWLGESYYLRGRYQQAAEQFLKVTTDHPKSGRGPEGMLKLGMSLNGLGAKEQACATFAEIGRRYPQAAQTLRDSVVREQRRAKC